MDSRRFVLEINLPGHGLLVEEEGLIAINLYKLLLVLIDQDKNRYLALRTHVYYKEDVVKYVLAPISNSELLDLLEDRIAIKAFYETIAKEKILVIFEREGTRFTSVPSDETCDYYGERLGFTDQDYLDDPDFIAWLNDYKQTLGV